MEELLETSEEYLYLPFGFVKFGDGTGGEAHVVCQEFHRIAVLFVKDRYPAESFRIFLFRFWGLEFDCLVYEDVLMSFLGQRAFFYTSEDQVVLVPDHEEYVRAVPIVQQGEVAIPSVCHHDAMRWYPDIGGCLAVRRLAVGNMHKFRKQGVEIEQCVKF